MTSRAIRDITDFIFLSDEPRAADVILVPGTSQSAVTLRAAELHGVTLHFFYAAGECICLRKRS